MTFRVSGLSAEPFAALFGLSEEALAERGVARFTVDEEPGFPDRITLRDVPVGQTVLLLNHVSQPADSPYRASHAIFVWENAQETYDAVGQLPAALQTRTLSLRAFDGAGMMVAGDLATGDEIVPMIEEMLANPLVDTIHAHYAKRGCYAARIERA